MLICTKHKHRRCDRLNITIDGAYVENVHVQKVLGIYIDNTLSWDIQINKICSKVNSKIALLKRIVYFLSEDMRKLFYNAYILSVLDYCCTVWYTGCKSSLNKIFFSRTSCSYYFE